MSQYTFLTSSNWIWIIYLSFWNAVERDFPSISIKKIISWISTKFQSYYGRKIGLPKEKSTFISNNQNESRFCYKILQWVFDLDFVLFFLTIFLYNFSFVLHPHSASRFSCILSASVLDSNYQILISFYINIKYFYGFRLLTKKWKNGSEIVTTQCAAWSFRIIQGEFVAAKHLGEYKREQHSRQSCFSPKVSFVDKADKIPSTSSFFTNVADAVACCS